MSDTALKYMTDQYLYEDDATVTEIRTLDDGRTAFLLDQSILYPQGGGQPADTGRIAGANGVLTVADVRFIDGQTHHFGTLEGQLNVGDAVHVMVDADKRHLHSRLHSAGHLIDEAVKLLGLTWKPTKGLHFPGQAAVEYEAGGTIADDLAAKLESTLNDLIRQGYETRCFLAPREDLPGLCHFVLPNMPDNKPTRVVMVWGDKGIPCGGTHVKNIAEIGPVSIRYVKEKKGAIKVGYELA